ncbi:MAG: 30S ribosome-binding factor RbfA [Pseudomonadota bacterium]
MPKRVHNPRRSLTGAPPSQRQLRAGELVRHALIEILAREDFRDPDLVGVSVTVGEVRCSPDLRHATVFVSPLGETGDGPRNRLAAALGRASGFLRGRLGREIEMKFTPELHFIADESYDTAAETDRLFADPKVRADVEKPEES